MMLRRMGIVLISAVCAAPGAHAEEHGTTYASIKAVVDYCARVDERHRDDYVKFGAVALAGVSAADDTGDYRAAYNAVSDALGRNSEAAGRSKCAATLGLKVAKDDDRRDDDRR